MSNAPSNTDGDWVAQIGKPAYESIAELVAALQCDRDRLEELRDERDAFIDTWEEDHPDAHENGPSEWASANPDEAEELAELEIACRIDGDEVDEDEARERINDDALSLRIFGERIDGEWQATTYELLLSTGGPAVRIVGEIDGGEASNARLEVQDWFKP